MKIKIEKGIPAPPKRNKKYPLLEMEVGDSFLIPSEKAGSVWARTNKLRRDGLGDWRLAQVPDQKPFQHRVWRIK
ncbi:hypothetical protein GCM10023232_26980 [Sphingosinicella ginsenosidimutans]